MGWVSDRNSNDPRPNSDGCQSVKPLLDQPRPSYAVVVSGQTPITDLAGVVDVGAHILEVCQGRYAWNPTAGSPVEVERYEARDHGLLSRA